MNSMGAIPGLQNNGLAIQFKSSATCLTVQNGNAILYGERAKGEFAMSCEVILKPGSLGVKLYPNPVVNNTKVQFIKTPPTSFADLWKSEYAGKIDKFWRCFFALSK